MNEETAVVATSPQEDLRLVALHPSQLEACQQQLMQWAAGKIESENRRCAELKQNFEAARIAGIRTDLILKHINAATRRVVFFQKVAEAVKAGYYIVPNMPMDVFAIRAVKAPKVSMTNTVKADETWGHHHFDLNPIEPPKLLPVGEGDYENPRLAETYRSGEYEDKGVKKKFFVTKSDGFRDEIDFPFVLARPEVLTATQQALALKIFDEIGAMPGRTERRSDPMVIGRLRNPRFRHDRNHDLSFLIAWFLDTDTI
jgi:hypothetical protein